MSPHKGHSQGESALPFPRANRANCPSPLPRRLSDYEWQKIEDGKKIPNYLYFQKESLITFAGLYEFRVLA